MIKLYKFGPAFGMPDASPFVLKLETYLRMTGQDYETATGDVRKAPRTQLPFVDVDGKRIPDSTSIIDHLEAARAEKLDAHLDADGRAVGLAFKTMIEEHLYFGGLALRWEYEEGWAVFGPYLREALKGYGVPGFMTGFVANKARKDVVSRARKQGIGRKPREELLAACNGMVDAIADRLGDKPHLCGDRATTFDATAYAFSAWLLCPAFDNAVHQHMKTKKNLVAYVDRYAKTCWKD